MAAPEFGPEYDTIERALQVGWALANHQSLTTTMLMRWFGVSRSTAYRLLIQASHRLPVVVEDAGEASNLKVYRRLELE